MKRSDINGLTKKEEIIWEQLMIKDISHSLTEEEKIKYNKLMDKDYFYKIINEEVMVYNQPNSPLKLFKYKEITYVSGFFKMYDTCGLPLGFSMGYAIKYGWTFNLIDFLWDSYAAGWSIDKIVSYVKAEIDLTPSMELNFKEKQLEIIKNWYNERVKII